MKISFVVPTYNCSSTIDECIHSIVKEMASDDELIVVDNGSSDSTLELLKSYSSISELLVRPDLNVGGVRNCGVESSSGEIIAFIDSDCVIVNGWRENVAKHFSTDNVDALGSRYLVPDNPHWIEEAWFSNARTGNFPANYINAGNFAIKKNVFMQIGGFDSALESGEDAELCLRLFQAGYVVYSYQDVAAIHLGNPKSIPAFYRQQYWHSLGALGTYKLNGLDKPLIATAIFMILLILSVFAVFRLGLFSAFIIALAIPFATVTYRTLSSRKYRFMHKLLILYFIYYLARSRGLLSILLR